MLARLGHRQVAREQVEQGRDVGRPLDAGVTAQGQDAAAGTAHVAQQQLDDGRAADVLHAHRVVRPADRVDPARGPVAPAVGGHRLTHLEERLRWHAAGGLHHLGRVAGVVPLEHLEHRARVLQGLVPVHLRVLHGGAVAAHLVPGGPLLGRLLALAAGVLGRRRRRCPGRHPRGCRLRRAPPGPRTSTRTCRTSRSRGRSRRTRRRGRRRPGSPRAGSSPRWCRRGRSRGSTSRC